MALRRPLKLDDSNNLVAMDANDLNAMRYEAIRQYAMRPAIVLQFDSDGTSSTSIGTINDSRYRASFTATDISSFPSESTTPNIATVVVTWDKIAETIAINQPKPIDSADRGFPLYYDGTSVRAMSDSDYIDTFIIPAIDRMTSGATNESDAGGTYFISTLTSNPNGTIVNTLPIFTDTRADSAQYTAAGIPEIQDQPKNIQSYYLFKVNAPPEHAIPKPVIVRSDGHIQVSPKTTTQQKLASSILWASGKLIGNRIRYEIDSNGGDGVNMGSGLVNTKLSGTGKYTQRLINPDDYRTQEFPNGAPQTLLTQYLKIKKI